MDRIVCLVWFGFGGQRVDCRDGIHILTLSSPSITITITIIHPARARHQSPSIHSTGPPSVEHTCAHTLIHTHTHTHTHSYTHSYTHPPPFTRTYARGTIWWLRRRDDMMMMMMMMICRYRTSRATSLPTTYLHTYYALLLPPPSLRTHHLLSALFLSLAVSPCSFPNLPYIIQTLIAHSP
ncbi:hypothetical protein EJ05DRAFT_320113 [Pseudovirgaria hyperparasitica]|uniref:Uncharacterized protein n=1 Tax=Pseudovirgaria hyperparasitica TaxID=470096 RepID=A0A6A6WDX3_9PEZI|nr:uncharacterized protein EJ05DRAFT_320113 [Pseudovirgaria hyperparasitica]KAF2760046.1 hypothetical protein EJ05DRAFT_320113 [Pseudovirgaria hyperparasitica]